MKATICVVLVAGALALGLGGCSSSTPERSARLSTDVPSGSITCSRQHPSPRHSPNSRATSKRLTPEHPSTSPSPVRQTWPPRFSRVRPLTSSLRLTRRTWPNFEDADLVDGEPVDFATNELEIAVPPTNPAGIADLADLADPGVKLVVCAPHVPCGAATVTVEKAADVTLNPVSEEASVTDVLGKVTSGEADAGLVYVTDVIAAGNAVDGIPFAESADAVNTYPIATLTGSEAADVAEAFVAFILGETGQSVLADAGFGPPATS